MKTMALILILFLTSPGATGPLPDEPLPPLEKVMTAIDRLYRSDSSHAELEMDIETPHWQRSLKMQSWAIGLDKTFIRILEPRKEHGVSTLRIENQMWNYLPKTDKVIKIPPSMMMSSWMGSDFTNDDLVKELTYLEDYTFDYPSELPSTPEELVIKAVPKEGRPIIWGYIVLRVRRADFIPTREEYFDEKGKLMRIIRYEGIQTFGKKTIPTRMEVIPTTREGHRTVVTYKKVQFDIKIDENIFSLRNLRQGI